METGRPPPRQVWLSRIGYHGFQPIAMSRLVLWKETMKLYNDDCLNVLRRMDSETVDCVVTDCPYHIVSGGCTNDAVKIGRYTEPTCMLNKMSGGNDQLSNTRSGKLFSHNDIEFREWLPQVYRILKMDTHCYIMINSRNLKELWQAAEEAGFEYQNLLVWDKGNATPNKYYMQAYELILMLRKGAARNINEMGTQNILRVPNITRVKYHPTEKSVELMEILIENSTNEGDIVIDPFMGSGATGVACRELRRDFIGCEIDEKYFKIAKERIENYQVNRPDQIAGQTSIFDLL